MDRARELILTGIDVEKKGELDASTLLDLAVYAFLRLDGAWFLAAAEKFGVGAATELDVKAWESFSERLGKKIATTLKLRGEFRDEFPLVMKIQNTLMNAKTEIIPMGEDRFVLRTIDCEVWKMVRKMWTSETAPCYKVTKASISGLLKGAFPGARFEVVQKRLIPKGDPCCEVEISRLTTE